jgi:hypothetical protein
VNPDWIVNHNHLVIPAFDFKSKCANFEEAYKKDQVPGFYSGKPAGNRNNKLLVYAAA